MKSFYNILGATKFEVHLQIFSDISTRAGCAVTIHLGITREASQIGFVASPPIATPIASPILVYCGLLPRQNILDT